LSSRLVWEDVLPKLAAHFRVIAADLPGFGQSEKPPPARYAYGFDAFAESLVDVVAALGLGRISICGHGMGGSIALTLARATPRWSTSWCWSIPRCTRAGRSAHAARQHAGGGALRVQAALRARGLPAALQGARLRAGGAYPLAAGRSSLRSVQRARGARSCARHPARHRRHAPAHRAPSAPDLSTLLVWGRSDRSLSVAQGRRLARELAARGTRCWSADTRRPRSAPKLSPTSRRRFLPRGRQGRIVRLSCSIRARALDFCGIAPGWWALGSRSCSSPSRSLDRCSRARSLRERLRARHLAPNGNALPAHFGISPGTDRLFRDQLARVALGARLSLTIALGATAISSVLGAVVGMVAATTKARRGCAFPGHFSPRWSRGWSPCSRARA